MLPFTTTQKPSFLGGPIKTWLIAVGVIVFCSIESVIAFHYLDAMEHRPSVFTSFLLVTFLNITGIGILSAFIIILLRKVRHSSGQNTSDHDEIDNYLMAMELAKDGVCITDSAGFITYVNDAYSKYHGYDSSSEMIGKNWDILFDPANKEWLMNNVIPRVQDGKTWVGKTKGLRKDGTLFDQELKMIRFLDGGFIAVCRDVSEEMQAENLSRARLAAIEASKDGIGIVNERGVIIFINKALMDLHGIPFEDKDRYIGRHWENIYTKKGRKAIKDNVLPHFERYGSWSGEAPIEKLSGGVVMAELALTKLPDGGMIGTARDISQKKQNEAEKAKLKDQFYQAQKMEAIGRLAGGMAHDFNNILAAMMGYSEFLLDDLKKGSPEHGFVKNIYSAGLQARDLIDHMLAFSRRSEGTQDIIDICDPFEETVKLLGASLPRSIEIKSDIDVSHPFIKGNATQIGQALMNLCVNSKDAMADEQGVLTLRLDEWDPDDDNLNTLLNNEPVKDSAVVPAQIKTLSDTKIRMCLGHLNRLHNYIKLTVEDTGTGISRDVAEHIFEPFYTTKPVNEGTGLGMAMVHGVIFEHEGAMFMESEMGKGTRFEIFFPMAMDDMDNEDDMDEGNIFPETAQGSGHILVIEDQDTVRAMLEEMLTRIGYNVTICEDPVKGLNIISQQHDNINLVITDHTMPKMTGIALAQKAIDIAPALPFILISGYSQKKLDSAADLSSNIKNVVRKPLKSNELAEKITDILSRQSKAE